MIVMPVYTAARISKPEACVPALVGTPRTMDKGSETVAAHRPLGLVKPFLGTYLVCSSRLAMMGRGHGKYIGLMSTGLGADPPGPATWLGEGPCIMGKAHPRSTCFIPAGACGPIPG